MLYVHQLVVHVPIYYFYILRSLFKDLSYTSLTSPPTSSDFLESEIPLSNTSTAASFVCFIFILSSYLHPAFLFILPETSRQEPLPPSSCSLQIIPHLLEMQARRLDTCSQLPLQNLRLNRKPSQLSPTVLVQFVHFVAAHFLNQQIFARMKEYVCFVCLTVD